ncbi:hypothetical protein O9993_15725 [Vibrio lentus]|nr:hypothetical protein [Vibrio lentus]
MLKGDDVTDGIVGVGHGERAQPFTDDWCFRGLGEEGISNQVVRLLFPLVAEKAKLN